MKFISSILIGVLSLTRAEEVTSTPPLKLRVNTDVIRNMFYSRDQDVFKSFTDVSINTDEGSKLSDLVVSLSPKTGEVKDFNFNLSIAKDNMGASSTNIKYHGSGKLDGAEFTFSGLINEANMKYALGTKYNHDHKYEALVFQE